MPRRERMTLKYTDLELKPPFEATNETINCPLPLVKPYNPVDVRAWCHAWAFQNVLCKYAADCHAYLDLLLKRINEGTPVDADVLEKLGIDVELIKRRRR
jgi:hypothetical protein